MKRVIVKQRLHVTPDSEESDGSTAGQEVLSPPVPLPDNEVTVQTASENTEYIQVELISFVDWWNEIVYREASDLTPSEREVRLS